MARARRPPPPTLDATAPALGRARARARAAHRRRRAAADRPAGSLRCCTGSIAAGDRRRHRGRRRLARRRAARRPAGRRASPTRAALEALPDERPARAWWTTPRWSPPSTAPGSAPTRPPGRSWTPPAPPGDAQRTTSASSASTSCPRRRLRARLLAAHDRSSGPDRPWTTPARLHDPVCFHQLGGFGAVALDARTARTSATCWAS